MTAKEVTINYLESIKVELEDTLQRQVKHKVSKGYLFNTMQLLVAVDLAIDAVLEGEGE